MQDFGTKADNSPPPGGQLSAAEFNNLATENENAVLRSGLALSGASVLQLATSIFLHASKAATFQDSGAANAYVATPASGASGVLLPADYAAMNGAIISFRASASNTTASTLNFGQTTGTLIGTKAIVDQAGNPLISGAITAGNYVQLRYDSSIGAGSWVLMPWAYTPTSIAPGALNVKMSVATASATATLTADLVTVNTAALGGKAYQLPAFSASINLATTGAGGMDTGAAPVSGFVALYAIYNPVTGTSALLGTNATSAVAPEIYGGANMPAGFTASALISVWPTTAASLFVAGYQVGRSVNIAPVTVLSISVAVASLTSLSIASAVPKNAKRVQVSGSMATTVVSNSDAIVAGNAAGIASRRINTYMAAASLAYGYVFGTLDLASPQTIFYTAVSGGGTPSTVIFIYGYEF